MKDGDGKGTIKFKKLMRALRSVDYVEIYFTDVDGDKTMIYSGELDKLPLGKYRAHKNDFVLCVTPSVAAPFGDNNEPYNEIELYEKGCNIELYQ